MRRTTLPFPLVLGVAMVFAALVAAPVTAPLHAQGATPAFPHTRHEGLFPQCVSCHAGIPTGDSATMFPAPAACAHCHDGVERKRVDWQGPTPRESNLHFSHVRHARSIADTGDTLGCLDCHRTPGQTGMMAVSGPQPQYCITCHAHAAPTHLDTVARCTTCHVPLVRARFSAARIEALPKPPDHDSTTWVLSHAPASTAVVTGRCAVCHARESCERCHFNADLIPAIQALARDERVAAIESGRKPRYPRLSSHDAPSWDWKHGAVASGGGVGTGGVAEAARTCSNCHAQPSCRTCHRSGDVPAIRALPAPARDSTLGVRVPRRPVHPVGFLKEHPSQAAAGGACAACHTRSFCVNCHQGQKSQYHPPDFVEQHGSEAYNNDTQCVACHSTEGFCRTCHLRTGRGARTRTSAAFHGEQPLWLLNHGQAARQGLEACASCHTQESCAQCHSANGGWRIDPHPPGFDARRAQQANPQSCLLCHATVPNQ